jgi:hypothetical protein
MPTFKATEFKVNDEAIEPTGRVEIYQAETPDEAVEHCLYTRKLANGNAFVGPSKRVVHDGATQWAITRPD